MSTPSFTPSISGPKGPSSPLCPWARLGTLAFGLLLALPVQGLEGAWQRFSGEDGLPGERILAIAQDRDGYLWLGTDNGAVRYDGSQFETYTRRHGLAGNQVRALHLDNAGHLWLATNRGLSRHDSSGFVSFGPEDGLADESVEQIFADRAGQLWFTTPAGVSRYDGSELTSFTTEYGLIDDHVLVMAQGEKDHIWFGTAQGASRYDGQLFTSFTPKNGLSSPRVQTLLGLTNGIMWLGTDQGLNRYDGEEFTSFFTAAQRRSIHALFQDRQGQLWLGTDQGLNRYDGTTWEALQPLEGQTGAIGQITQDSKGALWMWEGENALHFDGTTWTSFALGRTETSPGPVFADREGYLWFGSDRGLHRFDGGVWQRFTQHPANALLEDSQGRLWMGSDRGLHHFDGHTWSVPPQVLAAPTSALLQTRDGVLWQATAGQGLRRYRQGADHIFTAAAGLADNWIYALAEDPAGPIWAGTGAGLSRFDGTNWITFTQADGLPHDYIYALLHEGEQGLWVGTGAGLAHFDGAAWQRIDAIDGPPEQPVRGLHRDRNGDLWVGSQAGLHRYNGTNWKSYNTSDGLPDNRIQSIVESKDGHLWIGTAAGLARFDGRLFQTLERADGLSGHSVQTLRQTGDGSIWIGTEAGLSRFRPPAPAPPAIFLDAVVADKRYTAGDSLSLPSNLAVVAFQFHGISLKTRPNGLLYRYRLQGRDASWKYTRQRQVEYDELPVGQYRFAVQAVDRDLVYSPEPVTVPLTVHLAREWLHWLAALGAVGLLCLGLAIRLVQRTRQLNRRDDGDLEGAHRQHRALMPSEECPMPGFALQARCLPAPNLGGDLFHWEPGPDRSYAALVQVDAQGQQAASDLYLLSGILKTELAHSASLPQQLETIDRIIGQLSRPLRSAILAQLQVDPTRLGLVGRGGAEAFHFAADDGQVKSLPLDSAPLELTLAAGDRIVLCSAGLLATTAADGTAFGTERTAAAIAQACAQDLDTHHLLRFLIGQVKAFSRGQTQTQDQTAMVLAVPTAPSG